MPELPEVETVRRFLEHFKGKVIKDVIVNYPKMIENVDVFKKSLIDKEIMDIKREGKWLIFVFNLLGYNSPRLASKKIVIQ
jgi:formamidopyrimidine-DNA glycosylase